MTIGNVTTSDFRGQVFSVSQNRYLVSRSQSVKTWNGEDAGFNDPMFKPIELPQNELVRIFPDNIFESARNRRESEAGLLGSSAIERNRPIPDNPAGISFYGGMQVPRIKASQRVTKKDRRVWRPYTLSHRMHEWTYAAEYGWVLPPEGGDPAFRAIDFRGEFSAENYVTMPNLFNANDVNELIAKLGEKARKTDFNPSVSLGEAGKTLDLISSAARRLANTALALRRGDFRKAVSTLYWGKPIPKEIYTSSIYRDRPPPTEVGLYRAWLELQLGWKPLLSDIKSGAEYVSHTYALPCKQNVTVSKTKNVEWLAFPGGPGQASVLSRVDHRVVWRAVVQESLPGSSLRMAGLTDPAILAWELAPLSFVFDWIYPFGSYLQARGANQRVDYKEFTSTSFSRGTFIYRSGPDQSIWGQPGFLVPHGAVSRAVDYTRSARSTSVPTPIVPNFVPLGQALSWRRCLTAISLLGAAFLPGSKGINPFTGLPR